LQWISLEKTAEAWITQHAEPIIHSFFRQNPGSRGAIILNSVAVVKRVTKWLRERLAGYGLRVEENTGFSAESQKVASYQADVLVGTSTVDVGVDFKINLLLFEALDAGSFIQRFGRLGRHDGYMTESGRAVTFHEYGAYALVPQFIYERLFI